MKGLFKYIAPFAPDYSGASSVLFELGGLTVICDAGGCSGIVCGYDEPRFYKNKSALFSAALRDLDTIFGRDDILLDKIADAASQADYAFIACLGTPAPAVTGTDFKALAHAAVRRFDVPALFLDTNGMDLYDRGQEKAYMSLFCTYAGDGKKDAPFSTDAVRRSGDAQPGTAGIGSPEIGVIGATPLDMPGPDSGLRITEMLHGAGYRNIACYGMGAGIEEIEKAGSVRCNLVVSPSGLKAARWLRERFGTPYAAWFPLDSGSRESIAAIRQKIESAMEGPGSSEAGIRADGASAGMQPEVVPAAEPHGTSRCGDGGLLIIHQQAAANALRKCLLAENPACPVTAASWFMLDAEWKQDMDAALREEDDLPRLISERRFGAVAGDPLFRRALPADFRGEYIDLPHYAVSGCIYAGDRIEDSLALLKQYVRGFGRVLQGGEETRAEQVQEPGVF